jgi:hypothetical protein
MKSGKLVLATALVCSQLVVAFSSQAALPPRYQNIKDLNVMISYIRSNPKVLATLQSIDFANRVIYYGYNCKARFRRKVISRPDGWVGPAAPLQFASQTCGSQKKPK